MTRTIETDITTSYTLESPYMIDWLETESWEPLLTEDSERIYAESTGTDRDKEDDTTTGWTADTATVSTSWNKENDLTTIWTHG